MALSPHGVLTLPSNPNGIVFAGEAVDVLRARTWRDVQQMAGKALKRFHRESRLPASAWFASRITESRRNQRYQQVIMLFVFDGPATAEHLALLEEEAAASPVFWSPGSIERVPTSAVPSLMIQGDRLHQLWAQGERGPVARRLTMGADGVRVQEILATEADPSDFLPDVQHVIARAPGLDELDADLERMRLAFAQHFTRLVVEADGVVREDEIRFLERVFPAELMQHLGLGSKADRDQWLERARRTLPTALGHHDKLALIGLFFSACYSDGLLDAREMRVLREAGEQLGLTRQEVVKYLQRLW